ncbi:oligopeptide/dipeptide ABC transporter, ATPase subunit [Thermaerobacter marianensis DSM 12885]|uniref:Oligopeptide/dipeptide ABC transporter, ATPase subunit n=1 Tax=Thermaerobacter marianensis (strain ATCC 700841 / DSM 12885 / JCM 10246 / 7p75a) TaxID=644966 RepID=E6SMG0_THEM7|nr:ABC transporter ATP-binding protein [Thermaerobacter marianensis]ADU50420.1 oligopeptide/dipeptide ABC transporter, ATPase subunit [Thermaerobacter marianensis DSM 12885]
MSRGVAAAAGAAATGRTTRPLLEVQGLTAGFLTRQGPLVAVEDVSFHVGVGETVCLVGESGSGKSVTSLAIMRLLEYDNGTIFGGRILLDGTDLVTQSQEAMRRIRGRHVAMVFQEPMTALNPVFPIGDQIAEAVMLHEGKGRAEAWARAVEMLRLVGIPEPEVRVRQYPHQFSGGMRQRAMIAMALACRPRLLIADEPTTALDVTIQAQILDLLRRLKAELGMSILLITHDMGVAAEMADRIVVLYAGRVVEEGPVDRIFERPAHPYTMGLLASVPDLDRPRQRRLRAIPGSVPSLDRMPRGCRFHPRCPYAEERCRREEPPLRPWQDGHVACWLAEQVAAQAAVPVAGGGEPDQVRRDGAGEVHG